MRVANSLDELKKIIKDDMLVSVATDVVDKVQDRMIHHIASDVYEVYEPFAYKRRYNKAGRNVEYNSFDDTDNTGLLDRDNIVATITDRYSNKVIVTVENYTLGSKYFYRGKKRYISRNAGKPIANVIETGIGYDIYGWEFDGVPRPFIQNTFDDLARTEDYAKAFVKSMRAKGYDIE